MVQHKYERGSWLGLRRVAAWSRLVQMHQSTLTLCTVAVTEEHSTPNSTSFDRGCKPDLLARMACELTPCGSLHSSGAVVGGLQTAPDGIQAYASGTAVVLQREGREDTVLQGSDGKVRQREAGGVTAETLPQSG